jgi:hypothetical protein
MLRTGAFVSGDVAALVIICGAALLAGWVDVKFPRMAPSGFIGAGLHMLASMLAVQLVASAHS